MALLSSEFYPTETTVQGSVGLYDPEFDPYSSQVIWQSGRELWVAPVNRMTGDILMQRKVLVANDLAPISPSRSDSGEFSARTSNGPEWLTSQNGSEILYTKAPTPDPATWQVWSAAWDGLEWITRFRSFGSTPIGSSSSNDPNPKFLYRKTTTTGGTETSPLRVYHYSSDTSTVITRSGTYGARWVNDESQQVVYAADDASGNPQVFIYDVALGTSRQITFEESMITRPYVWKAPELGDRLAMLVIERNSTGDKSERMAIYIENQNGNWNKLLTLEPPTNRLYIYSAEPSTYGQSSAISLVAKDKLNLASEGDIWLVLPFTSSGPLYRKINGAEVMARNDPESLPTAKELIFYYNSIGVDYSGPSSLVKASTGLIPAPVYLGAAPASVLDLSTDAVTAAPNSAENPVILPAGTVETSDSDKLNSSAIPARSIAIAGPDILQGTSSADIFAYNNLGLGGSSAASSSWDEITAGDVITGFTSGVDSIDVSATNTGGGAIAFGSQPSSSFNSDDHSIGIVNAYFSLDQNRTARAVAKALDLAFNRTSNGITINNGTYHFAMAELSKNGLLSYNIFELVNVGSTSQTFVSPEIRVSHLCSVDTPLTINSFIV